MITTDPREPPVSDPVADSDRAIQSLIETYNAQLGEIAWHSVNVDTDPATIGDEHTRFVENLLNRYQLTSLGRPVRFLEVAPYLHTTAQWLNQRHGAESALCDISPHTLRAGQAQFNKRHGPGSATLVAGDFHELPFQSDFFDIVFIASAVHHTLRPERVLAELLRVTRPGGLVLLYNEPVGSDACFYAFRSNRPGELTSWEQQIADADLLRIVSSPFPGSRSEQLFGMIENDRIPLDVYLNTGARIESLDLTPLPGPLDHVFVKARPDAKGIADEISRRLESPRLAAARRELLMGYRLPDDDEIRHFAQRFAQGLQDLDRSRERTAQTKAGRFRTLLEGATKRVRASRIGRRLGLVHLPAELPSARTKAESRLFGAALRMVLRKPGNGPAASSMFARRLQTYDGVQVVTPRRDGLRIRLGETTLPPFSQASAPALADHFPTSEWTLLDQGNAWAQCLTGGTGTVRLAPGTDFRPVLLLRYYAVAHDAGHYWVEVHAGDRLLDAAAICQSESRLLKVLLPPACSNLRLTLRPDDGTTMTFSLHLRVAFLDVIAIETEPDGAL